MKAADLKNSILQLAISGRLVPQDPADEPASVLYEKVREEKRLLIQEGKIKPTRRVKKNDCINQPEPPFEIPLTWIWVKLGDISLSLFSGKSPKYSPTKTQHKIIGQQCNQDYGLDLSFVKYGTDEFVSNMPKYYYLQYGDVLLNTLGGGTVGRSGIFLEKDNQILTDGHLFVFRNYNLYMSKYLYFYLQSKKEEIEKNASGTTNQIFLSLEDVSNWLIPLPPLAEQKRIVEKVEELEPLISRYDKVAEELARLKTAFPDELKNSILQDAVSGRLVPQNPVDEPASALYEQIQAEKKRLIKEGKIKPSKLPKLNEPLNPPFQIPDSWMWVRLDDIGQIIGGGTPKTEISEYWDGNIPWLTPADMKNIKNKFVSSRSRKITELGLQKSSAQLLPSGSIVYSSRAPIGYLAITKEELCTNQGFRSIVPYGLIDIEYLYYILQSRFSDIISRASGTTFLEISGTEFGRTLIPLAPLDEQHRIVNKVDELMELSHQFEQIIHQAV